MSIYILTVKNAGGIGGNNTGGGGGGGAPSLLYLAAALALSALRALMRNTVIHPEKK